MDFYLGIALTVGITAVLIYGAAQGTKEEKARAQATPREAEAWHPGQPFCKECFEETINVSSGDLTRGLPYSRGFTGASKPCPTCGSVIRQVAFKVLGIPVVSYEYYRVIYAQKDWAHSQFYSRRLRSPPAGGAAHARLR